MDGKVQQTRLYNNYTRLKVRSGSGIAQHLCLCEPASKNTTILCGSIIINAAVLLCSSMPVTVELCRVLVQTWNLAGATEQEAHTATRCTCSKRDRGAHCCVLVRVFHCAQGCCNLLAALLPQTAAKFASCVGHEGCSAVHLQQFYKLQGRTLLCAGAVLPQELDLCLPHQPRCRPALAPSLALCSGRSWAIRPRVQSR